MLNLLEAGVVHFASYNITCREIKPRTKWWNDRAIHRCWFREKNPVFYINFNYTLTYTRFIVSISISGVIPNATGFRLSTRHNLLCLRCSLQFNACVLLTQFKFVAFAYKWRYRWPLIGLVVRTTVPKAFSNKDKLRVLCAAKSERRTPTDFVLLRYRIIRFDENV